MPFADSRRWFPLIVGLIAGAIAIMSFWAPNPVSDGLLDVVAVLVTVALLMGIGSLLNIHRQRVAAQARDWGGSLVVIVTLPTTFVIALLPNLLGAGAAAATNFMFQYIYQPLAGSLLALLAFFALRAAWRAFQVRPGEAAIIVSVAAAFLIVSGPWAALVPGLEAALDWIRAYPVLGVARGLLIGVGIGALVTSVRVLLGLDQPYLDH